MILQSFLPTLRCRFSYIANYATKNERLDLIKNLSKIGNKIK